jgi:hypothetical protein
VRGIVAAVSGMRYCGVELRAEQVAANRQQWADGPYTEMGIEHVPRWRAGDAFNEVEKAPPCDFIYSCPPYGNLEKYSELPQDLSTMQYGTFIDRYAEIILRACSRLRPDRFAAFVVANYRDKETGKFHDFVGDTVRAFESAGCEFYNEAILINAIGTAAMRANNTFLRGHRKLVKCHQNVLVFVKGSARAAAAGLPVPVGMEGATKDEGPLEDVE